MQPATVRETVIDLGTVRVTRERAIDPAQAERAAAEEAEYQEQMRAYRAAQEEALWIWLGARDAAHSTEFTGEPTRTILVIGKTEKAVQDEMDRFRTRYPGDVNLTRFNSIQPWHKGFRATGSYWSFS